MTEDDFKIGDKVVCIDDTSYITPCNLELNKEYVVGEVDYPSERLRIDGRWYFVERFMKAKRHENSNYS